MSSKEGKEQAHLPRFYNKWSNALNYKSWIGGNASTIISKKLNPLLNSNGSADYVEVDNPADRIHTIRLNVGDLMRTQRLGAVEGFQLIFDGITFNTFRLYRQQNEFIFVYCNDKTKDHQDSTSSHPPEPPDPPKP